MVSLLDDVSADASRLLDVLLDAWPKADQWPHRQYVAHEMATAGLDLVAVLHELPEWNHGYQAVRVLHRAVTTPQGAPAELGDQIAPTIYGLVHQSGGIAAEMVQAFLSSVRFAYTRQMTLVPDPVRVKAVTVGSEDLITGIRRERSLPFGEVSARLVRLMLTGEPATWLGVPPDPDAQDWNWNLWFGSLRPYAVETGLDYLAALEDLIAPPPQLADSSVPVEPSALPRALDHLDTVWLATAGQRLFKRPAFARAASLAEAAASATEFEARCNALYDVISMLTVPNVGKVQGALNLLKEDLKQRITDPESLERAKDAVNTLQQVVRLRTGQAHSGASRYAQQAAAGLGVRLTGDWADAWDQVRRVAIEAVYSLIAELDAARA